MGSVALLLWRNFGQGSLNWLQFFTLGAYVTGLVGTAATAVAAIYLYRRSVTARPVMAGSAAPWAAGGLGPSFDVEGS